MSAQVIDLNERRVIRAYQEIIALIEDMTQNTPPLLKKLNAPVEDDDKEWLRPSDSEVPFS